MNTIMFESYSQSYYHQVCDFLIALNREKKHINWNWARWEWMYAHPYFAGYNDTEVANILGVSPTSIARRKKSALLRLRELLEVRVNDE